MNYKDVETNQIEILKRIYQSEQPVKSVQADGILPIIKECSEDVAAIALGNFGMRLRTFSLEIDLSHPDLASIYHGQLVGHQPGTLSRDGADLLRIAGFPIQVSSHCESYLRKFVSKTDYFAELDRVIDSPFNNCLHVRFLPNRVDRDSVRRIKRCQEVGLGQLYSKGISFWEQLPNDFSDYYRGQNRFQKDIDEGRARMSYFLKHGLRSMSDTIEKSVLELETTSKMEMQYSFNRVGLTNAAIILAKLVGYEYAVGECFASKSKSDLTNSMAYAVPEQFPQYDFFDDEFDSVNEGAFRANKIEYSPRVYTFEEMRDQASEAMLDLVNYLESFPEANNKSIFDHYRVLVPSLAYPNKFQKEPFHFKLPDGQRIEVENLQEAQKALDICLLKQKCIAGVLLGERNGDHFFLSYWI